MRTEVAKQLEEVLDGITTAEEKRGEKALKVGGTVKIKKCDPMPEVLGQSAEIVDLQVQEYDKDGFTIQGIVGMNGSPSCGVELTWADDEEKQGPGAFIRILKEKLKQKGLGIPIKGIKAYEPEEAVATVKAMILLNQS